MSSTAIDQQHHFTYGDYMTWPEGERWELIDGTPYNMTPAPTILHQRILIALGAQLYAALEDNKCEVFVAPFDVRLPDANEADEHIASVVQPDIAVICDPAKIDKAGCRGAPDFIIEIISPSTATKDQVQKKQLYEKHGVREYWILHPAECTLAAYKLNDDGVYKNAHTRQLSGKMTVKALPGLEINLDTIGKLCAEAKEAERKKPSPSGLHSEGSL